ncbi:hypothetical protein LWC35_19280 [Pseudonocardia kujensis]|uniref:hypothetical protein n=1 Tax=Pseudonocardia kujensis TaxID=1128675 RepID=UPI001E33330B|nr:hypothetical protein [Pseudonocardia kujensis]MCE0765025.1 hypothetical protein [Pseudonocardia kujensis]
MVVVETRRIVGRVRIDRDDAVDDSVERLDPGEVAFDDLAGRDVSTAVGRPQFSDRVVGGQHHRPPTVRI